MDSSFALKTVLPPFSIHTALCGESPTVYIDSDGVLVDWVSYMLKRHFPGWTIDELNGLEPKRRAETLGAVYEDDPLVFAKLTPFKEAQALIDAVDALGVNWYILTSAGSDHPSFDTAKTSKLYNLCRFNKVTEDKVIVTPASADKQLYAGVGKVLIDDFWKNINQWEEAGGVGVKVSTCGAKLQEIIDWINGTS
jgi:hypothetical protein